MRRLLFAAMLLTLSLPARAQVQWLVKAGWDAASVTRGAETLRTALAGTTVSAQTDLLAVLGKDLSNPDVAALFQAARAGELNLEHPLVAEYSVLLSQETLLTSSAGKSVLTDCGQGLCPSLQNVAREIDEAASVAAGVPPGKPPAFLAMRPTATMSTANGQKQVIVESVTPEIDGGRVLVKRVVGDPVHVQADLVVDGHDVVKAIVRYKHAGQSAWSEAPMRFLENDRWAGEFQVTELGEYEYQVQAWVDDFSTWQRDVRRKLDANRAEPVDFMEGEEIIREALARATGSDATTLGRYAEQMVSDLLPTQKVALVESEELTALMDRWAPRNFISSNYGDPHRVRVDRPRARFSAWYEFFPRSVGPAGEHGTLAQAQEMLPYVREMGFDVVYLPPIHPIGRTFRKGPNNIAEAAAEDVGSPWAIGAAEGGHKSVHPELGTVEDFERFVAAARENDLEVAMDLAFQVSPDHPYVRMHGRWFRTRPDGTIAYAENPPKLYQDIHNFDWQGEAWPEIWTELKSVVDFWADRGVRVFRVDNPHTKPIRFWRWLIENVKAEHPDVVFLSEAFTKPKLMNALAKAGFDQSYTYFTWRTTKWEIQEYMNELVNTELAEYFRPNFWPNTPDILPAHLHDAAPALFKGRLVLASTLSSNYGIYGPAYELMERTPLAAGREEYLNSEKFQLREWDTANPENLRDYIARVNEIRAEHPALHSNNSLRFLETKNDQIIAYSKQEGDDIIVTVVNLDPVNKQVGQLELPIESLGIAEGETYQMHDLISDARYEWTGRHGYIELDPGSTPAHIFKVRRRVRTEGSFEVYE